MKQRLSPPSTNHRSLLVPLACTAGALASAPVMTAAASAAAFTVRTGLAERRGTPISPDAPTPRASLRLAGAVAIDAFFSQAAPVLASGIAARHYEQSSRELDKAVRFYGDNGWLDDPHGYLAAPPPARDVTITRARTRRGVLEVARFNSDWQPRTGEPGRDRWLSFRENRQVVAALLRHDGEPRPWLVCLHGVGMGRLADVDLLRIRRIHSSLGLNVILPTLPLHGPRRAGFRHEQQFVSNVYLLNNILGLAQSVWDTRRILGWLRDNADTNIGVFGFSLGSYVASLLSTVDADLACVIAVVPNGDIGEALRVAEPLAPKQRRLHRDLHDYRSTLVHRVVSPLAKPCRVSPERRFIIAGEADRIATPQGALMLSRHWEQSAIEWRPAGHMTTCLSAAYDNHVAEILGRSGLSAR